MPKKPLLVALFSLLIIAAFAFNGVQEKISFTPHVKKNGLPPGASISGTTSVCLGDTPGPAVSFVGSGGTAPYIFTYSVNGQPNQTITTSGSNSAVNLFANTAVSGTFTYELVSVEDATGDSDTASGSATITVNNLPVVDFTFNNNNTCSGTPVNFTSIVSGGNAPYTYNWTFGDGTNSSLQNPNHNFEALGCGSTMFNVNLEVIDANGCRNSIQKNIDVIERPDINFKDANFSNEAQFFNNCSNSSPYDNYTITVENITTATCVTSYTINWGDGSPTEAYNTTNISHTYTYADTFEMVITGIGTNGCVSEKVYVVKNASNPQGNIVSPGSTQNLCAPAEINFTISANWGGNSIDTVYEVDYGDGTTATFYQRDMVTSSFYNTSSPTNSTPYPIPHTYSFSNCPNDFEATITIQNSCATTPGQSGGIRILKNADANFESDENNCLNTPVEFTNISDSSSAFDCSDFVEFTWDFGDGSAPYITNGYENVFHTYTSIGNYTVTLTADNDICDISTFSRNICIEPSLASGFTLDNNNDCTPLSVQTTNTTDLSDGCGGETYLWQVFYTAGFCATGVPQWNFTNGTDENSASPSFEFISAGTYTLQLTTTNTCGSSTTSQTVEVKRPPTASIDDIPDFCGTASINPVANVDTCAPPTETITYSWNFPGGTPATANTLNPGTITYNAPGNYQITFSVTSSCGTTTDTEDFVINEVPSITNTNLTQTICSGTQTTEVILTSDISGTTYNWTATAPAGVSGYTASGNTGIIPVQTLFNSNATSEDVTYTIIPSNGNCDGTPVNLVITVEPAPEFTNQPIDETICLNGPISTLSVNVNGSGLPTYQWYSNTVDNTTSGTTITGETSNTFTPPNNTIGAVYYYVIVSFSTGAGCNEITSNTARVEVVDNIQIDTNPLATQSVCVGGSIDTALEITHSGGTGTITYQWFSNTVSSNTGGILITGATSSTYTPPTFTVSGNYFYYVEVSISGSGCSPTTSTVSEVVVVDDPTITNQPLSSQTLCQGAIPQNLEVSVSGGIGAIYNYQWYSNTTNSNIGGTLISGATNSTYTPPTNNVGTLYYYVVIEQVSAGCNTVSNTAQIIINAAPTITNQPTSETICFGESFNTLSVIHANGVGTPTYQWYSNTVNDNTSGTTITGETGNSFTPPSGTIGTTYYYIVIRFSSGGCTEITSQVAQNTVNETPNIDNKTAIICSGNTFDVSADTTGGDIAPTGTTYTWSAPTVNPVGSITGTSPENTPQNSISQLLTNLTTLPATVTYTVTPTLGLCAGNTFQVVVTVNPSISITYTQLNSLCYFDNGGALDITISGGVPFTTGSPYQINWTGPNGYTNTNEDITNLAPGDYTVSILDDGGCPYNETFTITEPDELIFSSLVFDPETISCFGANDGEINIEVSGGTEPYTYNWTRNGITYNTTQDLSNLPPGDYEVTVTDVNNCQPIIQSFQIIEPQELQVSLNAKVDVICFGEDTGEININTIGGRPIEISPSVFDYTYSWTGPNGFTSTDQNLTNLFAGTYNLVVTDKSNCTDNLQVIINQSDEIVIDYSATEIECDGDNDATITINNITGGNAPYSVAWSNLGSGLVQNNLSPGTYIITVTDATNCSKQASVIIASPPIFRITPEVNDISCFGNNDGRIVLNLEGGEGSISLNWDDDATAGVERNNLGPGTYTVTITDSKPCVINETFTITEPNKLSLEANITDALDCDNPNSGAIDLHVIGGSPPFTYSWSHGYTNEDLSNVARGVYTVIVTDSNDCEVSGSYTIDGFAPLNVDIINLDCDITTGFQSFAAEPSGGIPPYQINWSSGNISGINGEIMETDVSGSVIVTITDSFGCFKNELLTVSDLGNASFVFNSLARSSFDFLSVQDPIQFTNTSTGDYTSILWDFGDGSSFSNEINPIHTYFDVGEYTITQTVTYASGCIDKIELILMVGKGYDVIIPNAFTPNKDKINDLFLPSVKALSNMELNIYDTWGGLIYSEKGDNLLGWNGSVNGSEAENGNYLYTFSGITLYGKKVNAKGNFVLIK